MVAFHILYDLSQHPASVEEGSDHVYKVSYKMIKGAAFLPVTPGIQNALLRQRIELNQAETQKMAQRHTRNKVGQ